MGARGKYVVVALMSCGIIAVVSIINVTLCCFALIYRSDCSIAQTIVYNSDYLLLLIYRQYVKDDTCPGSLALSDLMHSDTVFVLTTVSLAVSAASLAAALSLAVAIFNRECWYYLNFGTYVHVGFCLAMLVVDITFATHFGMDYMTLTARLNANILDETANYTVDMIRIGAFFLMVLAMKGFVAHAINLMLLVPLIYYLHRKNAEDNQQQHSNPSPRVMNASSQTSDPLPVQYSSTSNLRPGRNVQPNYTHNEEAPQSSDSEFLPGSSVLRQSTPQTHFGISPHRPFTYSAGLTSTMLRSKPPNKPKPYTPNPDYGR